LNLAIAMKEELTRQGGLETMDEIRKYFWLIAIAFITLLGLCLRLWGIGWGLPNALHYLSYHPDETVMLFHASPRLSAGGLNIFAGSFLPHWYHYGSLQPVLINSAVSVAAVYDSAPHAAQNLGQQIYLNYLVGRLLTVLMGSATVWALWAFGRRIYGESVGLFGALFLALAPLHAQHSHFMTVDVPATLWVVLSLVWSARAQTDELRFRALIVAGIFAGFAAATKYNCALALLAVIVSAFTSNTKARKPARAMCLGALAAVLAAAAAYLIGCPGTLFESGIFWRDFRFEALHVSSQQELWFLQTGVGWWYILERNLADGLGLPLLIAALAGWLYALWKRNAGDLLTLSFAIPYYLVVGAAVSRYARYEIPLLPILSLWAARVLLDPALFRSKAPKWAGSTLSGAVALFTLVSAVFLLEPMSQVDPRDRAEKWLAANVSPTTSMAMPVVPWFWSPPLSPYFALPGVGQWLTAPMGADLASRLGIDPDNPPKPFDPTLLVREKPAVVVMSEYEYFDRLRIDDPDAVHYMSVIDHDYSPPLVFADAHWLGGRKSIDTLPCQDLPHDMLYPAPTILIFRRR
jgi:4-amino-4-deoxy-L-arabinose transferase-like glycosyltransferase